MKTSGQARFLALPKAGRLALAVMFLLALIGGGPVAAAPNLEPEVHPLPEAGISVLEPPEMPVCHRAVEATLFLPLVMRGSNAGASQRTVPAAPMTIHLGVAYIYDVDITMAQSFGSLLSGLGFDVYYVPLANVPDVDLTACDLVIAGYDTGDWSDSGARNAVIDTGLPVAAIGEGGLNFLGAAGLLEELVTGSGRGMGVEATLRGREAYLFPKAIPLEGDDSVQVYSAAGDAKWLDLPEPLPDGVEVGRLPDTTQYPIVQLQQRFLLWGFGDGPESMTEAGKDLFENALALQSQGITVPLRTRRFIPEAGVEQAFLDELAGTSGKGLHAYVQFRSPPGDEACHDLANLEPMGVTELYRLHAQTHVAFMSQSFDPEDRLVAACLRWVGRILPQDRAHPTVLAGDYPEWADNGDGTVDLMAQFMPDVSASTAEGILDELSATHEAEADDTWAIVTAEEEVGALTQEDALRWLTPGPMPILPTNDDARSELFADEVQGATISGGTLVYNGLDGTGVVVGVFDNGTDETHADFAGRILRSAGARDHGTHVAGIIGASGELSAGAPWGSPYRWRGMAPGVELAAYQGAWRGSEMKRALNTYNIEISNHSYVMTCGDYDGFADRSDALVRGDLRRGGSNLVPHLAVWAAANQGEDAQYCTLVNDDETTGPRGFYSVLSPAKNPLTVGALDPSSDHPYGLRGFSSRGPTWDGRLKPDVMGIGCIKSTIPDVFIDDRQRDCDNLGDDYCYPYDSMCGTSMASPSVCGVAALAIEQYHGSYGGRPSPEALKALLINTATDLVQDPVDVGYLAYDWDCPDMGQPVIFHRGPDYATGYGAVNALRAVNALKHKDLVMADLSDDADVDEYTFDVVEGREELRIALVWSDPAGDPSLDVTVGQLVNDLNLELEDPNGGLHYPWVLNPLPAAADHTDGSPDPITQADITPAYRAVDDRNNVEQVVVWSEDVGPGDWAGTWTARVSSSSVDSSTMPQAYALAGEWREISLQDIFPIDAGYNLAPDPVLIPVRVRNPYANPSGASGAVSADNWQVRIGDSASSTWSDATVESAYGPVGDLVHVVIRPPAVFEAGILYDIEVTLLDVYQVDERESEAWEVIARTTSADAISFLDEPRPPVDEMLLVDTSDSMAGWEKLKSAQNAARAFADRRQAGDMIGLSFFSYAGVTLYDLTEVSAGETELESVKTEIDNMTALGFTALGQGLLEAKAQLDTRGNPTHTWSIVLLGDGVEFTPPCWSTNELDPFCNSEPSVQPEFVVPEGCPPIQIDTVALGPEDMAWEWLLEDIAEKTCGYPWIATVEEEGGGAAAGSRAGIQATPLTFPEALPNTLADIYISIADGNSHQQRLWEEAGILSTGELVARTVSLESGLPQATFAVNWPDAAYPFGVKLFRPTGVEVEAADPDAYHKVDATHEVYRMDAPDKGDWTLQVGWKHVGVDGEYLAVASGHSDVAMLLELGLLTAEQVPGAEMPIYVVLVDEGGPLTGANVQLAVRRPGGGVDSLLMHDDGSQGDAIADDGVYTNEYTIRGPGAYEVKARAEGTAHDGEPFLRHRLRHFRVASELRVAYVMSKDSDMAEAYKALLDRNGLDVTLVDLAEVETTDLSPFSLTIIGPDTGQEATWGDVGKVAHIRDSGKPVVGLGDGGYAFFGQLGLDIGYDHGTAMTDTDVIAEDADDNLWNEPYDVVPGTPDGEVTVYGKGGSPGVVVYVPGAPPDVEKLAQRPMASELYWLAREERRYLLWGFNLGPPAMTNRGQALFVNTAYYALR